MSRPFDDRSDLSSLYAPPTSPIQLPPIEVGVPEFLLFFRWEKLRLIYNAVLGLETAVVLTVNPPPFLRIGVWLAILAGLANLCFCLGPVLDGYAHWMGLRSRTTSLVIFAVGTVFSALVAYVVLVTFDRWTLA